MNGIARTLRETPFWWEDAPRPAMPPEALPPRIDVAIVGSGVTGLSAAIPLARAGRSVLVLEADAAGEGASSRNAGFLGRTLKHGFAEIMEQAGLDQAIAVYREMDAALQHVDDLVAEEGLDCAFRRCGRFMGALSTAHYDGIAREYDLREKHLGEAFAMIEPAAQSQEIGSDYYRGGVLLPDLASIHPGRYQLELLRLAIEAGVQVATHSPVTGIAREGAGFTVRTGRGDLAAGAVFLATNGYTGPPFGWFRRRLIPFHGFLLATEPLTDAQLTRTLPGDRTYIDYAHNIDFIRRSPDGRRILFGGQTGGPARDMKAKAARLHARLVQILPDLAGTRVEQVWTGKCAATFDLYPHIGQQDGIHYAMGYCFAGMPMGSYLGHKAALRILGDKEGGHTVFAERRFRSFPFYTGNPWFVPLVMAWYDRLDGRG